MVIAIRTMVVEMSTSMYASAVQDPVPTRSPIITPVGNPTEVPSWNRGGDDETEEVQHDSDNDNPSTAPRRFRVGKPVANTGNWIQGIEWAGWENPFHRNNRNRDGG